MPRIFCQRHYYEAAVMRDTVRRELFAFQRLMIFLLVDLHVVPCTIVFTTDSAEAGWAFTHSEWMPRNDAFRV